MFATFVVDGLVAGGVLYGLNLLHPKPIPPSSTTGVCSTNKECADGNVCVENKCAWPVGIEPYPMNIVIGIVVAAVLIILAAYRYQTPYVTFAPGFRHGDYFTTDTTRTKGYANALISLIGIGAVGGAVYLDYTKWKRESTPRCTNKAPDTCADGESIICGEVTDFKWTCSGQMSDCKATPPKCSDDQDPVCDDRSLQWKCPLSNKCKGGAISCPSGQLPTCNSDINNGEWRCDIACPELPDDMTCPTGQHPECLARTRHQWKCEDDQTDACAAEHKPSWCEGAYCTDTAQGIDWVCPGHLTRTQVCAKYQLFTKVFTDVVTQKTIHIYFKDTDRPVHPTINDGVANSDLQTITFGPEYDALVGNPQGNLSGTYFVPYDEHANLYYKDPTHGPHTYLLSIGKHHTCQHGGIFAQTKAFSKTGKCTCVSPWTGEHADCQYSDAHNCHSVGTVNPTSGSCACRSGYAGSACQYSDAGTCSGHGKAQNNATCVCENGYIGNQCQAPPPKHFGCEKFWTGPGHSSASHQIEGKCHDSGFDRRKSDHDCGKVCWACQFHSYWCENTPDQPDSKHPNK